MKPPLCRRILPSVFALVLSSYSAAIAAVEPAKIDIFYGQAGSLLQSAPAHDYYTRLAELSGEPSAPDLPIDAQRHLTPPAAATNTLSRKSHYITVPVDTFEIRPPPANSSLQTRAELNYLLRLQEQRTPMEMAANLDLANWGYILAAEAKDRDFSVLRSNFFRVGRSIGTWFNHEKLPKTSDLVARLWQDARYYLWSLKLNYARVRPYYLEPKLKNLQDANWPAYPSGHASYAYILAYLYSTIRPEHTEIFLYDAYTIAHSREIIGVHFPSDSEAARVFAQKFVGLLLKNDEVVQELKIVKEEWEKAAHDQL